MKLVQVVFVLAHPQMFCVMVSFSAPQPIEMRICAAIQVCMAVEVCTLLHELVLWHCFLRIECPTLTVPTNGGIFFTDDNFIGSVAVYGCDEGYSLTGAIIARTCQLTDQTWTGIGSDPTCERKINDHSVCNTKLPNIYRCGV